MKNKVNSTTKTVKFVLGVIGCAMLLSALAVVPATASQGTPPPGWIFELAPPGPQSGVLSSYQQFTTSFVATSNYTYVSFAFREIPRFFAFDNASVTQVGGTGTNLLSDPGFESAIDPKPKN
jgi:hypothetical protein